MRVVSIFLISFFHPVFFLSLSFACSSHKNLLEAITAPWRERRDGRIDSTAEDGRKEGEGRCCKKITVAYTH